MLCAACANLGGPAAEGEDPALVWDEPAPAAEPGSEAAASPEGTEGEDEVALSVAESEAELDVRQLEVLDEVMVSAPPRERHEVINDLVLEARALLEDVELEYVFTGKGKKETLRGRPVAFALWSESKKEWTVAHLEIPRPPVSWKPGGKALKFRLITPGLTARHVRGTGAERLMFSFARDGEPLKVYGRKFPVFDNALLKKKRWRAVAQTARPVLYLPFTEDTLDPLFVSGGRDYLLYTARRATEELREANAPSVAFPGQLLADVVPPEVITTLAVIEQLDDTEFVQRRQSAVDEVLSHYGLKLDEAYRYSVSTASAVGPMQFTDRKGNGTYSLVVRRCREARLDPDFQRGATNLLNAMKAAICLFDIELAQMRADIRVAYRDSKRVLGIFPVAAYNGGPRNVTKLYNVLKKMKVPLADLRMPGEHPPGKPVKCPCVWKVKDETVVPVSIPSYNRENRGYVEKYLSILTAFD